MALYCYHDAGLELLCKKIQCSPEFKKSLYFKMYLNFLHKHPDTIKRVSDYYLRNYGGYIEHPFQLCFGMHYKIFIEWMLTIYLFDKKYFDNEWSFIVHYYFDRTIFDIVDHEKYGLIVQGTEDDFEEVMSKMKSKYRIHPLKMDGTVVPNNNPWSNRLMVFYPHYLVNNNKITVNSAIYD